MADIDWKDIWNSALKDSRLFTHSKSSNIPSNAKNLFKLFGADKLGDNDILVACPTRFDKYGKFAITVMPLFNEDSIEFTIYSFNDAISNNKDAKQKLKELILQNNKNISSIDDLYKEGFDFNGRNLILSNALSEWESKNRLSSRYRDSTQTEEFKIESSGFKTDKEAVTSLIDYINEIATWGGNMFNEVLDNINSSADFFKDVDNNSYDRALNNIRESRRTIFKKVEEILKSNYKWKSSKNEDFSDSTASFTDRNGNLAAVVSIVDDNIIVDIAKGITAKVSMMQSDEAIEDELTSDIDAAEEILDNREVDHLKDLIDNSEDEESEEADEYEYLESLERKVTRLESLYIRRKLR